MLTCKQASQLISQSLDRRLSFSDRIKLRFHLFICDACSQFGKQLNVLRGAIQRLKVSTENDDVIALPAEAKARIAKTVASKQH